MLHNVTHAWRHESCQACRNQYYFLQKWYDSCFMTWLMFHDMTHASLLDSFTTHHVGIHRNRYIRMSVIGDISDYNNSSDVKIYLRQTPLFLHKKESTIFAYIPGTTRGFTKPPGFRPSPKFEMLTLKSTFQMLTGSTVLAHPSVTHLLSNAPSHTSTHTQERVWGKLRGCPPFPLPPLNQPMYGTT